MVGGGLAGLTTAHTVLERGGRVVLLDKMAFLGKIVQNACAHTLSVHASEANSYCKALPD